MNTKEIRERLEPLVDLSTGKTLGESKAIKHIGIDDDREIVILLISIGETGGEAEKKLRHEIAKILKLEMKFKGVKFSFEENKKLIGNNVKFIIVSSGKGGVGKSVVAANLACALARSGRKVGLIDADIYDPSIPDVMEVAITTPEVTDDDKIVPFRKFGVEIMSTEFFADRGRPIMWRGSQLSTLVNNYFNQVAWDKDLEYMIIDAPPGTGDIMLDLKNIVPNAEYLLVTTPHNLVSHMVKKTGAGAKELNHNIIGVVENMAYYIDPKTNEHIKVFGEGGADDVARLLDTEVLATIPLATPKNNLTIYESEEEAGKIFDELAALISIR